jgi:hypothetical protein
MGARSEIKEECERRKGNWNTEPTSFYHQEAGEIIQTVVLYNIETVTREKNQYSLTFFLNHNIHCSTWCNNG